MQEGCHPRHPLRYLPKEHNDCDDCKKRSCRSYRRDDGKKCLPGSPDAVGRVIGSYSASCARGNGDKPEPNDKCRN